MSRARLSGIASAVAGVALAVALVWVGWLWYDSRLPGRYDLMDYGVPDYGGGPHAGHGMGADSVEQLGGPATGKADFTATLTARKADVRLDSGRTVHAWTFDGRVPGPELRVHRGDLVAVTLVNRDIADGVSIHWHGVDVPNREDGVSGVTQDAVRPGERYTYRFRVNQVGTFWYHSHQVAAKEVRRGLYGAFVILPRKSAAPDTLDLVAAVHTFPGAVVLGSSDKPERRTAVAGRRVRLRLVNTDSSARRFVLAGVPFRVAAIDGTDENGATQISDRTVELGAGARYDLAFTMPQSVVKLEVPGSDAALVLAPLGEGKVPVTHAGPTFDPDGYGAAASTPFNASSRFVRDFKVDLGRHLGFIDGRPGYHWSINGKLFPRTPMYVVRRGDLVRMTIVNHSGVTHPMHLHGHHFLVLSREGRPVGGSPWWVDTLNVKPDERYEVGFRATNPGVWMFHCHNLPHARDGLTMHVVYEGVTTPFRVGDAAHNHPE